MRHKAESTTENWNYFTVSVLLVTALTLGVIYLPVITEWDRQVLDFVRSFLSQFPSYIPAAVTNFGLEYRMFWPQLVICSVLVSHRMYFKAFLLVLFSNSTYYIMMFLKNLVCRERPIEYIGYSFPSGHSLANMCLYGLAIYLIMHYTTNKFWKYLLSTALGLFILFIGITRLWLGVHYPTDVIAGYLIGFAIINLYIIICKTVKL